MGCHPLRKQWYKPSFFINSGFHHIEVVFLLVPAVHKRLFCLVSITSFSTSLIILPYRCLYDASEQGRFRKALVSPNSWYYTQGHLNSDSCLLLLPELLPHIIFQWMFQAFITASNPWKSAWCLWLHASERPVSSFWSLLPIWVSFPSGPPSH